MSPLCEGKRHEGLARLKFRRAMCSHVISHEPLVEVVFVQDEWHTRVVPGHLLGGWGGDHGDFAVLADDASERHQPWCTEDGVALKEVLDGDDTAPVVEGVAPEAGEVEVLDASVVRPLALGEGEAPPERCDGLVAILGEDGEDMVTATTHGEPLGLVLSLIHI